MKLLKHIGIRKVGKNGYIVNERYEEKIKPKVDTEIPNIQYSNEEEIFIDKDKMAEFVKKEVKKL